MQIRSCYNKTIKNTLLAAMIFLKGGDCISSQVRELRNGEDRLLCKANDATGEVETIGPHKTSYIFSIPIGGTFTVIRGNTKSLVTRTSIEFIVDNYPIAA